MLELIEVFLEEGSLYVKIFGALLAVAFIIADWKIHIKAGEKGWIALIPVYNIYSFYKIVWNAKAFRVGFCVDFVAIVFEMIVEKNHITDFYVNVILLLVLIFNTVFLVYTNYRASKAFGHGIPFTIGLSFLYGLFILILGFGKSRYVRFDNTSENKSDPITK